MDLLNGKAALTRITRTALPDGGTRYEAVGRIRFDDLVCRDGGVLSAKVAEERGDDPRRGSAVSVRPGHRRVVGTASSTGVDSYGTEMSLNALEGMAEQFARGALSFRKGVAYAPTHGEREWHQIVGRTIDAQVRQVAAVENAADETEPAYVLDVWTDVKEAHERGAELLEAIDEDEMIGQSIGGWFLRIIWVEDEHGYIDRVIVDEVLLDHLAATRTPSNGDSMGLAAVREMVEGMVTEMRTRDAADPELRHIFGVGGTENTVILQFLRPGVEADDVDPDELAENVEAVVAAESEDDRAAGDDDAEARATAEAQEARMETALNQAAELAEQAGKVADVREPPAPVIDPDAFRAEAAQALARALNIAPEGAPEARSAAHYTLGIPPFPAAERAEDPTPTKDKPMSLSEEELAVLAKAFGGQVRELLQPALERIDALEQVRTAAPAPDPAPAAEPDANNQRATDDADLEARVAARTRDLETRARQAEETLASRDAEEEAQSELYARMTGNAATRLIKATDHERLTAALDIRDDANFDSLIELAKADGNARNLVARSTAHKVKFVRDHARICDTNPDTRNLTKYDLRNCMQVLFRAAYQDGVIQEPRRVRRWGGR